MLSFPDMDIGPVHLATVVECGPTRMKSFHKTVFLYFQLHFLKKLMPFHFTCAIVFSFPDAVSDFSLQNLRHNL